MTQVYIAQLLSLDGARWLLSEPTVDQMDPDLCDQDEVDEDAYAEQMPDYYVPNGWAEVE